MHKKILQKYLGKKVQETEKLGYQCVAWAKTYMQEVFGFSRPFGGSAISAWINRNNSVFPSDIFTQIPFSGNNIPPQWAIIFWNTTKFNPYGHVAVVDSATDKTVTIIEQNGEKWSGKGENGDEIRRVTIGYHDRGKCLWWFIFNKKIMENIKIGSVNNYAEILKNELEKNKSYSSKFTEYKGENALSEKETKELIEIIAIRMEKGIKDYIDEKFLAFTRDIVKKN